MIDLKFTLGLICLSILMQVQIIMLDSRLKEFTKLQVVTANTLDALEALNVKNAALWGQQAKLNEKIISLLNACN